jgi:hypothetical protein
MKVKRAFKPWGFDRLESREVLSTVVPAAHPPVPVIVFAGGDPIRQQMANAGKDLIAVYEAFQNNGGNVGALAAEFPRLQFRGDKINISVRATSPSTFNALVTSLRNIGMDIDIASAKYTLVVGYAPVSQLLTISTMPQTLALGPNYKPVLHTHFGGFGHSMVRF